MKTTRFKFLRGSTAQRVATLILEAEVIYDKTLKALFYGDGVTMGGLPFGLTPLYCVEISADHTITNEDFVRVTGGIPVNITMPESGTTRKTVKNTSSQVVTILPHSGFINNNANLQIKPMTGASLGNSVDLIFEGGQWWVV